MKNPKGERMTKNKKIIFYFIFLFSITSFSYSPFKAYVNKTLIEDGESFILNLEFDGDINDKPDLSELRREFNILSQSQGQETIINNGVTQKKTTWSFTILPKKSQKRFYIPKIKLGAYESGQIVISLRQGENIEKATADDIDIEATTDVKEAYVFAQIIFTLKISSSNSIKNASLSELKIDDAIVEPMGETSLEERVDNGKLIHIFIRKYAIFPHKSGKFIIPSIDFEARISKGQNSYPHGFGFFEKMQKIRAKSKTISVNIKPIPENFPKNAAFLPLESLAITESFSQSEFNFKEGQATNRKFTVIAKGILPTFLPKIKEPNIDGLKIYTDNGNKDKSYLDDGVLSTWNFSHVYMPMRGGNFVVPEETIYWWDTKKDELKIAKIRQLDFTAQGSEEKIAPKINEQKIEKIIVPKENKNYWQIIAITALSLWIFTAFLVWFFIRRFRKNSKKNNHQKIKSIDKNEIINNLLNLCKENKIKEIYTYLLVNKNKLLLSSKDSIIIDKIQEDLGVLIYKNNEKENSSKVIDEFKSFLLNLKKIQVQQNELPPLYPK